MELVLFTMLSGLLNRLRNTFTMPDPKPAETLCVIGDIHGRADLLAKALGAGLGQIICVGDYVDRGENSAGVLRLLMARDDVVCLMGNHEEMMLKFIDDPERHGGRWLRYGGLQTLASFEVTGLTETSGGATLQQARDTLVGRMGPDMLAWLSTRPNVWLSGNIAVTHAGADPVRPIHDQQAGVLRWGHPDFGRTPRKDGVWVVHGHVIVEAPQIVNGRVNVDTGAYATGRLTMAQITRGDITFTTVT